MYVTETATVRVTVDFGYPRLKRPRGIRDITLDHTPGNGGEGGHRRVVDTKGMAARRVEVGGRAGGEGEGVDEGEE